MSRTRLQRITLILFFIVVANQAMVALTGYSLIGGDLFLFFLLILLILLALSLVWPWSGR